MDKKRVGSSENMVQCPLCGHKFSCEREKKGCEVCPFAGKACKAVRCPNCGYEIPIVK